MTFKRILRYSIWMFTVCVVSNAQATFVASTSTNTTGTTTFSPSNASQTVGWDFQVEEELTINALGIWDDAQDGLNLAHTIGLFELSGTELVSTNIAAGSGALLLENTRWVEITEIILQPQITYSIMADFMCVQPTNGGDRCNVLSSGNISYHSSVTQIGLFFSSFGETVPGSGINARDVAISGDGYLGPNFGFIDEFAQVPEPSTLLLLGLGLASIGFSRKRKAA